MERKQEWKKRDELWGVFKLWNQRTCCSLDVQDENGGARLTPRFADAAAGSLTMLHLDWEDEGHRLSGNKGEPRILLRLAVKRIKIHCDNDH